MLLNFIQVESTQTDARVTKFLNTFSHHTHIQNLEKKVQNPGNREYPTMANRLEIQMSNISGTERGSDIF